MAITAANIAQLAIDLPFYAKNCLVVKPEKPGPLEDFDFNDVQQYVHKRLEDQKRRTGRVRAIILKGRKQGISTYVAARFYHQCTNYAGRRVFVLAHDARSTKVLFGMTKTMHEHCPDLVRAKAVSDSVSEYTFSGVGGSYGVGTAGGGDVGRGDTPQLLHGSEVAFWKNTVEISSGIMQAVPMADDTEIILESTANGMGNMFHSMCMNAMAGQGDYELIFVPWYWSAKYRRARQENDAPLSEEEQEYMQQWKLDDEQMLWRRYKIFELEEGLVQFRKEYPACVAEAFEASAEGVLIHPALIMRARKQVMEGLPMAGLVVGVDAAGQGKDPIGVAYREGRICSKAYELPKHHALEDVCGLTIAHIIDIIKRDNPIMVNIDNTGVGLGVCDGLVRLGYGDRINRVNPGGGTSYKDRFLNKRAEMWGLMLEWFKDGPNKIPDDDQFHTELTGFLGYMTGNRQLKLEAKDSERRRKLGLRSPAKADAFSFTFAVPLPEFTHARSPGGMSGPSRKAAGGRKFFLGR